MRCAALAHAVDVSPGKLMTLANRSIFIAWLCLSTVGPGLTRADTLVWSDEFDGSSVNPANWDFMIGDGSQYGIPAWGNNELQYYTSRPENATVANGVLSIIARRENFGGKQYTSARLRTLNKADFLYGKMEARIKVPSTTGIWPAFWMLPTNSPYGDWAASGEIDIMESVNIATTIYGSIHFGGVWPNNTHLTCTLSNGTDYSQGFHVYTVEWTPTYLRWYVDGVAFCTRGSNQWYSDAAPGDDNAPFDQPFHFLLNVAVGGNFPGNPDGSSQFPQVMQVDWVRAYQTVATQTPFGGVPWPIPGMVEAENYDVGGSVVAYVDCDVNNNGGAYRPAESVDIEVSSEGGYNVGWICANEWIEYTVDVDTAGMYLCETRVASQSTGGTFQIEFDGVSRSGTVTVPVTGGWQSWTTIAAMTNLSAGTQIMRFTNLSSPQEYNVNWFRFTLQCTKGDLNRDGVIDGGDISGFVATILAPQNAGAWNTCAADVDAVPGPSLSDVGPFVDLLLGD